MKELAAAAAEASRLREELQRAKSDNTERAIEQECVVCFAERREVAFNCGHFVCCTTCGASLRKCPHCMRPIRKRTRIFQT